MKKVLEPEKFVNNNIDDALTKINKSKFLLDMLRKLMEAERRKWKHDALLTQEINKLMLKWFQKNLWEKDVMNWVLRVLVHLKMVCIMKLYLNKLKYYFAYINYLSSKTTKSANNYSRTCINWRTNGNCLSFWINFYCLKKPLKMTRVKQCELKVSWKKLSIL